MALEDIQKDKQLHEMLGSYQKELEQRDTYHDTTNTKDDNASKNSTNARQSDQGGDDGEGSAGGEDDSNGKWVDTAEITQLKEGMKQEAERANALQDKLETVLLQQVQEIKVEQESIRNRQVSLRNRIKSLQSSIHDMPESCGNRLQDALGEVCHNTTTTTLAGTESLCTVCQDANAKVWRPLPTSQFGNVPCVGSNVVPNDDAGAAIHV
eukprot:scaffold2765_cov165-Amphora_coffeaeformis.AAC.1